MRVPVWVVSGLVLLLMFSSGARAAADNPKLTPLVAEIIPPPHVVPGSDGRRHLVYELALTNITGCNDAASDVPKHASAICGI